MGFNPFIGKDQLWLETRLNQLQEDLAERKTIVASGAGDAHAQERIEYNIQQAIEQILAALYLLDQAGKVKDSEGNVTNGTKYPRESCFRARRTMPRYIWGS